MLRRRLIAVLLAALASAAAGGCGGEEEPFAAQELTIATGRPGGVYRVYGPGLANAVNDHLPNLRARARASASSIHNLQLLASGKADVAFTRADSAQSMPGIGRSVVALARLYDSYVQIVVRQASRIHTLEELAAHCRRARASGRRCRLAIGPARSGTRLVSLRALAAVGLALRDIRPVTSGIAAQAASIARGEIDAIFWTGGVPTPAIQALISGGIALRFVDLGEAAGRLNDDFPDIYTEARLPRAVYRTQAGAGTQASVGTVSVSNFLVARRDLDERVAYRLTALLFERRVVLAGAHRDALYLNRRAALDTFPLRLHPGASRYYAEASR